MSWWPPWRPKNNGHAAAVAKQEAEDQKAAADERTPHVDRTVRAANVEIRRADRLSREVERAMRLRRGPA